MIWRLTWNTWNFCFYYSQAQIAFYVLTFCCIAFPQKNGNRPLISAPKLALKPAVFPGLESSFFQSSDGGGLIPTLLTLYTLYNLRIAKTSR